MHGVGAATNIVDGAATQKCFGEGRWQKVRSVTPGNAWLIASFESCKKPRNDGFGMRATIQLFWQFISGLVYSTIEGIGSASNHSEKGGGEILIVVSPDIACPRLGDGGVVSYSS